MSGHARNGTLQANSFQPRLFQPSARHVPSVGPTKPCQVETRAKTPLCQSSNRGCEAKANKILRDSDGDPGAYPPLEPFVLIQLGTRTLKIKESDALHIFWGSGLDTPCMCCKKEFNDPNKPPIRTISLQVPQAPASEDDHVAQLAEACLGLPMMNSPLMKRYDHSEAFITWLVEGTEDGRIRGAFGHADSLAMDASSNTSSPSLPHKPLFKDTSAANGATMDVDLSKLPAFSIRIHNRHLECARSRKIPFVPISHVWHEVVSAAQRNHLADSEAARLVYSLPFRTLLAVANRYGHGVEIWHDYISIPQWQDDVQQNLLIALPKIYNYAAFSCVHLDDVSYRCIKRLMGHSSYGERLLSTAKLFRAQWFKRMWVCLEYAQSKEVNLITQDYHVLHDFPLLLRDVVRQFKAAAFASQGTGFDHFIKICRGLDITRASTLDYMRLVGRNAHTFGTVLNLIAKRECRDYRDRFTAMRGFLSLANDYEISIKMPQDATQACLWVARRCLERRDYTPLLLTPCGETTIEKYSWLTGHETMSQSTWLLGRTTKAAIFPPVLTTTSLTLTLEPVGFIESFTKVSFAGDELTTLQNIVAYIIQVSDSCPVSFMTAVSRIYYVPAWAGRPDRYSAHIKESLRSDRELSHDIHNLLEDFKMQAEPWQRQLILEDLVKLLRLSNTFSSAAAGFNRLSFAKHTQSSYGWKHADSLATVECQSCNTRSVFRLAMWKIVNTPLKLYRIPGLRFQHSMENGVGLAISRNRICGRMIYGTPACDCHGREAIEIV